jgi:hypothetical protein
MPPPRPPTRPATSDDHDLLTVCRGPWVTADPGRSPRVTQSPPAGNGRSLQVVGLASGDRHDGANVDGPNTVILRLFTLDCIVRARFSPVDPFRRTHQMEDSRMNRFGFAVAMSALLGSLAVGSVSTAVAAPPPGFKLLLTSTLSFHDAVLESANVQPAARPEMIRELSNSLSRLTNDGATVNLPDLPAKPSAQEQMLARTLLDLKNGVAGPVGDSSGTDPYSIPVFGSAIADNHAWRIETDNVWIGIYTCNGPTFNDCVLVDRMAARLTVNPGAFASRVDFNILYSPNSGGFQGTHFEWWSLVDGDPSLTLTANFPDDGSGLYPNGPSSGSFRVESVDAHNRSLAHTILLWAQTTPGSGFDTWLRAGGRTGRAFCEDVQIDNTCLY